MPTGSEQHPLIPDEPEEYDPREVKAFYDWRNDLFYREFDMKGLGRTDFMTARRTYRVWLSEFGDPIVLTMANPLFYWVDVNANGEFESNEGEMWSDPEEDGVNGNERHYGVSDLRSGGQFLSPEPGPTKQGVSPSLVVLPSAMATIEAIPARARDFAAFP